MKKATFILAFTTNILPILSLTIYRKDASFEKRHSIMGLHYIPKVIRKLEFADFSTCVRFNFNPLGHLGGKKRTDIIGNLYALNFPLDSQFPLLF